MAETPSYPEEASVGDTAETKPETAGTKTSEAKAGEEHADPGRTRKIVTGAAIGIGSAALVAALLYANRSRKGGPRKS